MLDMPWTEKSADHGSTSTKSKSEDNHSKKHHDNHDKKDLAIITNGGLNALVGLMLIVGTFLLMYALYHFSGMSSDIQNETARKVIVLTLLIASVLFVIPTSWTTTGEMDTYEILQSGARTGVFLNPGTTRLLFFKGIKVFNNYGLFDLWKSDGIHTEKKDVIIPSFKLQDKDGKALEAEGNGEWEIGHTDEEKSRYENMDAKAMPGNLISLVKRTAKRIVGRLEFWEQINGQEVGKMILEDKEFKTKCHEYGIIFKSLIFEVISGSFEDDAVVSKTERTAKRFKQIYPELSDREIALKVEKALKMGTKEIHFSGRMPKGTIVDTKD